MGEQFVNNFCIGFAACLGALFALILFILSFGIISKKFMYDEEYWWNNGKKPRWNDE